MHLRAHIHIHLGAHRYARFGVHVGVKRGGGFVDIKGCIFCGAVLGKILGENWLPDYVAQANAGGIERVLV